MIKFNAYVIELEEDTWYKVCIEDICKTTVRDNGYYYVETERCLTKKRAVVVVNMLFRMIMVLDIKISRLTLLSTGYYINLLFLCANAVCCCAVYFGVVWYCGCACDDSPVRFVG